MEAEYKTKILIISGIIISLVTGGIFYFYPDTAEKIIEKFIGGESFIIEPGEEGGGPEEQKLKEEGPGSPISGISCENYNRRPFAVMLAEDYPARPLSGISSADLVFEMPVITGSITRMMAVFQCESPKEIGSVRSARHDFIPLAAGLDAVFVHWGGSHFALDWLKQKIIDNLDALPNPFSVFYRKPGAPAPHNGFTNIERMINSAEKLGYRLTTEFEGYQHEISNFQFPISNEIPNSKQIQNSILEINYTYPYNVKYEYNPETNSYLRWRGGSKEIDRLTGQQVGVKNIVVMRAKSRQIEGQYNNVDIEGTGEALYYLNGQEFKGYWQKDKSNIASKLYFYDENDEEVKLVPGKIWIHIIEPYQKVEWFNKSDKET